MAKANPVVFLQQVRTEVGKVTWPTRRETAITTVMVFVMVFLACAFFFIADQAMSRAIALLFGFGR
jgi:preprotein translocase subunit SecE